MNVFNSISISKCQDCRAFRETGFTLLEILIAISLLAFISLGVVNITENAVQTKERTTEVNENNLQIETAMSRMEWDFSQIYSPLYFSTQLNTNVVQVFDPTQDNPPDNQNTRGTTPPAVPSPANQISPLTQQYYEALQRRFERNEHFSGVSKEGLPIPRFFAPEKNILEIFTTSNRRKIENQRQSHFAWVRYALATQEDDSTTSEKPENPNIPKNLRQLVRYFSADDPYGSKRLNVDDEERVKGAVLLKNVENLEFQFWDFQRRKWETSLRNIQNGQGLIRGIRVMITWYDSFGNKRTAARIFRPLWPQVTPQDNQQATSPQTDGTQGGTQGNAQNPGGSPDGV
jgi:prepilin-type N-terminal cleavage/methylation domain-containing protein